METKSPFWFLALSFFFVFSFQLFAQTEENGWKWQYPRPQGNSIHDVFMFSKDTLFAVGDLGTFMKTTDGGKSWDVKHHIGNTSYNLECVQFIDRNNGWATGGIWWSKKNVLLKTTDAGDSWTEVTVNTNFPLLSVFFVDSDTGIVVGEDGIVLRTTDGGQSWDTKKMDVYIAQDRGKDMWLDIFRLYRVTFTDKNNGWVIGAGYYGDQIYRTTDCGRTWKWTDGIAEKRLWGSLYDVSFVGKKNVFMVGDGGVFLKSSDGGLSWKYLNLFDKYQKESYQSFYSLAFTDSLNGWIVGGGIFYSVILKTTDAGENWTEVDSAKNIGLLYRVRFAGKDNGYIMGRSGLLLKTSDAGLSWDKSQGNNVGLAGIYFTDENNGWACGDSGLIIHTPDGGNSWVKQAYNPEVRLWSIYALDKNNVFAAGGTYSTGGDDRGKSVLMYTTDGGSSWSSRQDLPKTFWFESVKFMNDSTGWITGTEGMLLKTSDKGKSWLQTPFGHNLSLSKIQFANDSTGWVSPLYGNKLFKTTDNGKTWNEQMLDSTFWMESFYFASETKGWAVGWYKGKINILRTTDGGNTWAPCAKPLVADFYSVYFSDENNGWVGGYDYLNNKPVILKTTDGGDTWFEQNSPIYARNFCFLNESTGWVVGGGIAKTTNGGGIVFVKGDNNEYYTIIPSNMSLMQNYPNPFNPSTMIQYRLSKSGFVSLKVYDILGRLVNTLVDKFQEIGEYKIMWSGENLPSGIYLYQLRAGNYSETKKMLLLR